ncbi:hypothetical protein D3C71_2136940 [compost metagenome]
MMSTDKEISLNQAALALLIAARDLGVDLDQLSEKAKGGILNNKYRVAEHPHVTESAEIIGKLCVDAKAWAL